MEEQLTVKPKVKVLNLAKEVNAVELIRNTPPPHTKVNIK